MINQLTWSADVVNFLFALVGIWYAHSFFHSPKKPYQCALAWILSFVFYGIVTPLLYNTQLFSSLTYECLSTLVGFSGFFVYLYLFPQIPLAQRLFVYFFIDNALYLIITASRYISTYLCQFLHFGSDMMFLGLFLLLVAASAHVFLKKGFYQMKTLLNAAPANSLRYTFMSAILYLICIAFADSWKPMEYLPFWGLLKILLLCAGVTITYYVAFSSLAAMRNAAEMDAYKLLAYRDALTGLGNRLAHQQYIEAKAEKKEPCACFYLDINDFKKINDLYGHQQGDYIIKKHAEFLKHIAGDSFHAFRVGGDEFILFSTDSSWKEICVARIGVEAALRRQEEFDKDINFSWGSDYLTDYETDDIQSLEKRCDIAMYQHKMLYKKKQVSLRTAEN